MPAKKVRLGLAQTNPTVGALEDNAKQILAHLKEAQTQNCDLTLFPELSLTGYPPEDLIFKPAFIKDNLNTLRQLKNSIKKTAAVIGFIDQEKEKKFNAAAWIEKGKFRATYRKKCLPNYGVFDEKRYFEMGKDIKPVSFQGIKFGLTICEDLWVGPQALKTLKSQKPDVILNLSASPYHAGKMKDRINIIKKSAAFLKAPVVYCNLVGGQDELVFDGGSFAVFPNGRVLKPCPQFQTGVFSFDITKNKNKIEITSVQNTTPKISAIGEIKEALLLGIRDYVNKNGFQKVTMGLSGGIDSALVAALATEALGEDRVVGVTMPSQFNLEETKSDARDLAQNLGIEFMEIPIKSLFSAYKEILTPFFKNKPPNIAEENLQARIRGNILMALSNKFGWLVLTTGNKSETSTGYCTLYGDMAGGFAVLKDVLKTTVYKLSRFINEEAGKEMIPETTITRPPTAELRENQKDEDSLGSYSELDPIVTGYVEENLPFEKLVKKINKPDHIKKILRLIDLNEYKRRQAPPGIKITTRAFGRDHRMPMTNRYKPSK